MKPYEELVSEGYITKEGEPLKCVTCHGTEITTEVKDVINGIACEEHVRCTKCNESLGYWAYGSWDPSYAR